MSFLRSAQFEESFIKNGESCLLNICQQAVIPCHCAESYAAAEVQKLVEEGKVVSHPLLNAIRKKVQQKLPIKGLGSEQKNDTQLCCLLSSI